VPARFTDYEVDLPGIGLRGLVTGPGQQDPCIGLGNPLHDDLEVPSFSSLQSSLQYAIDKLEKYLEILDGTPVYWAALILHPGRRMKWVRLFYEGNDKRTLEIQRRFVAYFDTHYPAVEPATRPCTPEQVTGFGDSFYDAPVAGGIVDEVGEYLRGPVHPVVDPIKWWLARKEEYPRLTRMALEILSIPPCATECERTFSLAKLTIGSQRHSLGDNTLSELQCVRNWARGGLFGGVVAS
jgi:hypothetical protein